MDTLINLFASFTMPDKRAGSSQPDAQPQPIECAACFDHCTGKNVQVAGDHLCYDCFETGYVPQFHQALQDESKFPVKYGTAVLDPANYPNFFDNAFQTFWRSKEEEYNTPVKHRLYCNIAVDDSPTGKRNRNGKSKMTLKRCGNFLGSKANLSPTTTVVKCKSCEGPTCTRCSQPSSSNHECKAEPEDPFAGLERGVDYQICPIPTCQVKISLQDGCNGVRCAICKTKFCFICGEVTNQPGHWDAGKPCPRFGKKGSNRAIFDTPTAALDERELQLEADIRRAEDFIALLENERTILAARQALPELIHAPEFQLHERDRATLRFLHPQVLSGDRRLIHALIHALEPAISLYWDGTPRPRRTEEHARVRALVDEIGEEGFADWRLLRQIVDAYELAWERRMDELRQIVR